MRAIQGRPRRVGITVAAIFVAATMASAAAAPGDKLLALVGEDADTVSVFDVDGARDAPSFAALLAAAGDTALATVPALGVDLGRDVDRVLFAGTFDDWFVVVDGRFGKKVKAALAKRGEARKHRGVRYWVDGLDAAALVGKRLVLASEAEMVRVIDRHKTKATSLARSRQAGARALRDAFTGIAAGAHIRSVVRYDGVVWSARTVIARGAAIQFRSADGAVSAAEAAAIVDAEPWVQMFLTTIGLTATTLTIRAGGAALIVDVAVPEDELAQVVRWTQGKT
jgi:hypothetical protein